MTGHVLYHFSEDPGIERFEPRCVVAGRPPGMEWLNGPLVWAIDDWHQPMYLFPRDCPRILLWPTETTSETDRQHWFGAGGARILAFIETGWLDRFERATTYRYELPGRSFEDLEDAGMFVSRMPVAPLRVERLNDLPSLLAEAEVELRVVPSLMPFRGLWNETTFHVSGIRLRNAAGWQA